MAVAPASIQPDSPERELTCYLLSLKYAPGLWKEFRLLGGKIREQGFPVHYLVSREYTWMAADTRSAVHFISSSRGPAGMLADALTYPFLMKRRCADIFSRRPPAFLCVYNPHPLNFALLRSARLACPGGIRAIYLHEPAKPDKRVYGLHGRLFFSIVELCQRFALAESTDVILPSPVALSLFRRSFPAYHGAVHYAPIIVPDRPGETALQRRYFTMVGRFNFSKRLDEFIDAVNYAADAGEDLEFQIVTASPVQEQLQRLTPAARLKTRIVNKDELSDAEISDAVAQSIAVLCLHPMVTQSGVLTVAFMNGTPVIVPPSPGFTQFVDHGVNGWVLPERFGPQDLVAAMKSVRLQLHTLSPRARSSYSELFSESKWHAHYAWLLEALAASALRSKKPC